MAILAKVGTFVKSTAGAPASQAITGVGFQPKALIFWSVASTSDNTWQGSPKNTIGFASSSSVFFSAAMGENDAESATTRTFRRSNAKAIVFGKSASGAVDAECTLTSFDSDGFTLNWDTNNATGYIIKYLALGGSSLTNANVLNWLSSASTGNLAVTGLGFQPNFLFDASVQLGSGAQPQASNGGYHNVGATDFTNQWALANTSSSASPTREDILQLTTALLLAGDNGVTQGTAAIVSADSDGFTINESVAHADEHFTFALKGGSYKVGTVNKQTGAPSSSFSVTGLGFQPAAVMLFSSDGIATTSWASGNRMSISAFDFQGDAEATVRTGKDAVTTKVAKMLSRTGHAFLKANNDTATTDADGSSATCDSDGFTVTFAATNDAVATQILWVAFGALDVPSASFTSVSYLNGLFASPLSTPWHVNFTPTDSEFTGAGALTYEVRTAASGGGTLLNTNTCTSGSGTASGNIAYNASGLISSPGTQTLYIRVKNTLGAWSADATFTFTLGTDPTTADNDDDALVSYSSALLAQAAAQTLSDWSHFESLNEWVVPSGAFPVLDRPVEDEDEARYVGPTDRRVAESYVEEMNLDDVESIPVSGAFPVLLRPDEDEDEARFVGPTDYARQSSYVEEINLDDAESIPVSGPSPPGDPAPLEDEEPSQRNPGTTDPAQQGAATPYLSVIEQEQLPVSGALPVLLRPDEDEDEARFAGPRDYLQQQPATLMAAEEQEEIPVSGATPVLARPDEDEDEARFVGPTDRYYAEQVPDINVGDEVIPVSGAFPVLDRPDEDEDEARFIGSPNATLQSIGWMEIRDGEIPDVFIPPRVNPDEDEDEARFVGSTDQRYQQQVVMFIVSGDEVVFIGAGVETVGGIVSDSVLLKYLSGAPLISFESRSALLRYDSSSALIKTEADSRLTRFE